MRKKSPQRKNQFHPWVNFSSINLFFLFILIFARSGFALDLAITSSEDPIQDGTALTFTMTVSNPSATTLTNVVLEAVIPDYMSIRVSVETTPLGDCLSGSTCIAGGFIRWTLDTLSPGEVRVVRYSDVISTAASDGALLTAEAVVTADGVSAVQDSHTVVVSENAPRLQLSLSVDRNPAAPGALVIYQLRYSNSSVSPDDLTANSLTATLPQGMTFVSANGGGSETGGVVSWPISVASGMYGSREFTARVDSGLTNGTLLRIDARFEDSLNGVVATAADVLAVNATPSLDLAITSSEDPIQDGTALTFTMTVSNPSATTLTNVVLEAVIPDYMSIRVSVETTPLGDCLSGSTCIAGGFIRWTLDTLSPGEVRVVRYSDVISTAASDGALLTAEAVVTADGVSAVQDSHTVVVSENAPRLQLSLSVDRNPAAPGALVIYQLRYSNSSESPDDLTANSLTAMLPQGMTFVSANGGGSETGGVVSWPISIASGMYGSREFTARVDSGLTNGTLLRIDAHFEDSVKNIAATAAVVLAVNATPSHDENTVPTRPGALAVTAVTGSSATVSWGASTDADGDTITYHVEYRRNGVESWSDGGSTSNVSKSISGLEEGQYYSVRVTPSDGTEDGPSRTALNLFRTVATEPFIYVALGDSYSSGTSARHYFDTSPEDTPEACLRSPAAYSTAPSRLLEELAISGKISGGNGIQHTFLACHGAKGHDVVRNSQMPGAPTQIGTSDLSEDTDLVTITIGGNDVGFAELMIFIVRNYDDGSGLDGEKFGSSDDSWMDVMKQRIKDLVDNGTALVDYRWDGFTYTKGVPLTEVLAKIKDKVSDTNTSIFLLGYLASPVIIGPLAMLGFLDQGETHERQEIQRRTDNQNTPRSGTWPDGGGGMPPTQLLRTVILSLESEVRRDGNFGCKAASRAAA